MYDVSRRQRRKNRIVKKIMMGDNRSESIVEKLPLESEVTVEKFINTYKSTK